MTKINKKKPQSLENTFTEFLLYKTPNNQVKVEIFLRDENIWLTQEKIAALFGVDRSVVTKHLKNIFESGELSKEATCAKFAQVRDEGGRSVNREIEFYNLDAIISVGYRVNSIQATNFRIWATQRLKEYIIKGFTMDDERLKDPRNIFGKDYFDEDELDGLNLIVSMYLDYAENQTKKHQAMTMNDWSNKLNAFLEFNEQEILTNAGKVSVELAKNLAESEFEKYRIIQDRVFESDFDREVKKLLQNSTKES